MIWELCFMSFITAVYVLACIMDIGWLCIVCVIFGAISIYFAQKEYCNLLDRVEKLEKKSEEHDEI